MTISTEIFKHVRRIQIKTRKVVQDVLAGAFHSTFKGRGMEFEDVREYQPGDEVRSIDWNVTARMQYPYVKNYREERELSVILLIDVSASSFFGTTGKKKAELIAELGALFSFSAVQNNDKVGLILFSDHVEKYIPPKKGSSHAMRLIRELLAYKPQGKKTDIAQALRFLGKVQKRKSVVFLISDFFAPSFKDDLTLMGKRHDLIGVNVRDPHEVRLPKMGLVQLRDLETHRLLILDTSKQSVREQLEAKNRTFFSELKELFEKHAGGLMMITSSQSYIGELKSFFERRHQCL